MMRVRPSCVSVIFVLFVLSFCWIDCYASPCAPRKFDQDSIVCVCNASYCDTIDTNIPDLVNPFAYWTGYLTTKDGQRLAGQTGSFGLHSLNPLVFNVGNETRQTILGFGGAFTDAATITMSSLSAPARMNLLNSYFAHNGSEYNLGRVPMASCDFSQRIYSYDGTEEDLPLSKFSLVFEDIVYKIPAIKDAMKISRRNLSLFGSPWSSPHWMKSNNNMTGKGTIKGSVGGPYFKSWANYFVRFLQAYEEYGIKFWGLTAQNEPSDGTISGFPFQCLGFTPELQRNFISKDLGPILDASGYGYIKLMILDDQRVFLPYWAEVVLKDPDAARFISGIAVHWYEDLFVPTSALDLTYEKFGDNYFILNTEADEKDWLNKNKTVLLGNWHRGEHYFTDIMEDIQHGVSGWVDWNLALDLQGGPNLIDNWADSAIIVNTNKDEFYKQPMYYAMAHYSKFVTPGAKVLVHKSNIPKEAGINGVFFLREDNTVVANLVNISEKGSNVSIVCSGNVGTISYFLPAKSFATLTWYRL